MSDDKAVITLLSGLAMHALLTRHGTQYEPDVVAIDAVAYAEELLQHIEEQMNDR